jgi:pimeloyl-ACP methyl ester carboxylesterase
METHEYVEANGLRLHYVTEGAGPLMLLLHGFPEFSYAWKEQIAAFSSDYRVVALDLPGYNLSAKPAEVEAYAIPRIVAAVRGVLDRINPGQRTILVGHDWGGITAWAFAALHPDYLDKLVIINAPHPVVFAREVATNPAQQQAIGYMTLLRDPRAEALLSADDYARLGKMLFDGAARPDVFTAEDRAAYKQAWAQPGALTGALNYYRASALNTAPDAAAAGAALLARPIPVPTLVIWGEADPALLTGNLNGLEQFVPTLQIRRIPQGTHWVIHEEPALITSIIREFLTTA